MRHAKSPGNSPVGDEAARFDVLWTDHAGRVLAYARRHVDGSTAQEVVSETFLVAWRRMDAVPNDPLPWLLVVARNTIRNQQRSGNRRRALQLELQRLERVAVEPGADIAAAERTDLLAAVAALTSQEREALLLIAWDGLAPADAAHVAGCTTATFHVRLHRARKRLREAAAMPDHQAPTGAPTTSPSATHLRKATT